MPGPRHAPQAWRQFETTFDGPNMSKANEIAGSQTGSQRWQIPGDARPRLATVGAAQRYIGPHPAASGDGGGVPPKQEVRRQRTARRLRYSGSSFALIDKPADCPGLFRSDEAQRAPRDGTERLPRGKALPFAARFVSCVWVIGHDPQAVAAAFLVFEDTTIARRQ